MILYLAGPMSGLPQFNFPGFDKAAEQLRGFGYEVINPAAEDSDEVRALALASVAGTMGDLDGRLSMKETVIRNTEGVMSAAGLALLPSWTISTGAKHEVAVADRVGIPRNTVRWWINEAKRATL